MTLVELVYRYSAMFPEAERFSLTQQLRRSAVSVPSNIAEGAARRSRPDYLRFLSIARGSLAELDTQLQISERLDYGRRDEALINQVDRLFARLTALMNALSRTSTHAADQPPVATLPPVPHSPLPIPDTHDR